MYYWALCKEEDLHLTTMKTWKEPNSQALWEKDAENSAPPHPGPEERDKWLGERRKKRTGAPHRWQSIKHFPKWREIKKGVKHRDGKMHLKKSGCLLIE